MMVLALLVGARPVGGESKGVSKGKGDRRSLEESLKGNKTPCNGATSLGDISHAEGRERES